MSHQYYALRSPITSVKLEPPLADREAFHSRMTVWINHQYSGILVLHGEETLEVLRLLFDEHTPAMQTSFGGAEKGIVVEQYLAGLTDDTILIGEDYILTTVREVRAMAGAGRRDGDAPNYEEGNPE